MEVLVRDDRLGFTPETTPRGYGLERQVGAAMAQIGVRVTLCSAPGDGTMVTMTHPGLKVYAEGSRATPGKPGERSAENTFTMIG